VSPGTSFKLSKHTPVGKVKYKKFSLIQCDNFYLNIQTTPDFHRHRGIPALNGPAFRDTRA